MNKSEEQKRYSFLEINLEIFKTVAGVKMKILLGVAIALVLRMIPIIISLLIASLVNQNLSNNLSLMERLIVIIPVSISTLFICFKISEIGLRFLHSHNNIRIMSSVSSEFSQKTFERLSFLPTEYLLSKDSKEWSFLLNKRSEIINGISLFYMNFVSMLIELMFSIGFLFLTKQYLLGAMILVLIVCSLFFRFGLTNYLVSKLTKVLKTQSKIIYHSNEMISKLYLAKVFNSEDFLVKLRNDEEKHEMKLFVRYKLMFNILATIQDLILGTAIIFIFYMGMQNVEASVINLGLFIASFTLMSSVVFQLSNSFYIFDGILTFIGATQPHMEIATKYKEIGSPTKRDVVKNVEGKELYVKNISFAYNDTKILNNINFEIKNGDKVFLVGSSGAGKTTLLKILLGLLRPKEGVIEYECGKEARMAFSFVPQHLDLFNYSIRNNLLIGNPKCSEDEMWIVLEQMNMKQKVLLNGGLDCSIESFSGGEQQRISIARAILSKKSFMLLDEPTSSLDLNNEKVIIDELMGNEQLSFIFCTHRLQSIPGNSKVIVLNRGEIVQCDTKDNLLTDEGLFKQLYYQEDNK